MEFAKATKKRARLRMAIIGPAGSGKTFSALAVAQHLVPGGKIGMVDTERGSASKYADQFDFDVLELESFAPARYVDALRVADHCGFDVVIIDSLSHAWTGKDGALAMVDNISKRSRSGSSFNAWRDVTPEHNNMVDAMLRCPFHLIVTMRTKTEYVLEKDDRTGKTRPKKIGLAPVQRDGLEYEFDVVGDIDNDHNYMVTKTRCSALSGGDNDFIEKPGEQLAVILREWLSDGVDAPERQREPSQKDIEIAEREQIIEKRMNAPKVKELFEKLGVPEPEFVNGLWDRRNRRVKALLKYTRDEKLIEVLERRVKEAEKEATEKEDKQ